MSMFFPLPFMFIGHQTWINMALFFTGIFILLISPLGFFIPFVSETLYNPLGPLNWLGELLLNFFYVPLITIAIISALLLRRRSYYFGALLIVSTVLNVIVLFLFAFFLTSP